VFELINFGETRSNIRLGGLLKPQKSSTSIEPADSWRSRKFAAAFARAWLNSWRDQSQTLRWLGLGPGWPGEWSSPHCLSLCMLSLELAPQFLNFCA
jgi:hypothetical protein